MKEKSANRDERAKPWRELSDREKARKREERKSRERNYELVLEMLKERNSPFEISKKTGLRIGTVTNHLIRSAGEGKIKLSDIYFGWSKQQRDCLHKTRKKPVGLGYLIRLGDHEEHLYSKMLGKYQLDKPQVRLFHALKESHMFRGGMYEMISDLERNCHDWARQHLEGKYGPDELGKGWWREGIKGPIREKCASLKEADNDPCEHPYHYTTLIQLSDIITQKDNWRDIFDTLFKSNRGDKKKNFQTQMVKLNNIRNKVMHPVKPNPWSEEDFEFLNEISVEFAFMKTR